MTLRELPNGVNTIYGYNDLDQIVNLTHLGADGTVLASFSYERNGVGEPTKITREDGSYRLLGYDASLRLISENYHEADGTLINVVTYTYDAAGNRIAVQSNAGRDDYSYDPGFQLTGIEGAGGSETYSHDANGRLTEINRDGEVLDLDHDVYDRLQQVENQTTGNTTQYLYDGEGRRIGETGGATELRYLIAPSMGAGLDVQDLIVDEQGNLLSNHVYVGATPLMRLDAEGNPIYYLTDAMGSVVELADNAGQTVAEYDYDGFGNVRSSTGIDLLADVLGGDYRFQSQWLEAETGLYYFRARDYDSQTGQFISRDPVDIIEGEPESFNSYQFVYNNPYIYSDPTGEFTITELNASRSINDTVSTSIKRYVGSETKDFLLGELGDAFGNVVASSFNAFIPGASVLNDITKLSKFVNGFSDGIENGLQGLVCDHFDGLPLRDNLFFAVSIHKGVPQNNGLNCSNRADKVRDRFLERYDGSRPDFLFRNSQPLAYKERDPGAYLVGDLKFFSGAIRKEVLNPSDEQWNNMTEYARKYQLVPFVSYLSIFRSNFFKPEDISSGGLTKSDRKKLEKEALKQKVFLILGNLIDK